MRGKTKIKIKTFWMYETIYLFANNEYIIWEEILRINILLEGYQLKPYSEYLQAYKISSFAWEMLRFFGKFSYSKLQSFWQSTNSNNGK